MRLFFLLIFFLIITPSFSIGNNPNVNYELVNDGGNKKFKKKRYTKRRFVKAKHTSVKLQKEYSPVKVSNIKKRTKGKAILMAVLTGPLGGHRLYLGTEPHVPIVYALTLGGGLGLLPLVDIVVIILSKDINKYYDNPQIMMW